MRIDYPADTQLPQLRRLWQEAFGDGPEELDAFFDEVFSPDRCRCITEEEQAVAALYWLDGRVYDRPIAYLYAIATAKGHRGRGLCSSLMADTHRLLKELGYAGCVLVPGEKGLFLMYGDMGYQVCARIREFSCKAADTPIPLRQLTGEEYAALRRRYLPEGGVIQEGENLVYLQKLTRFYAGEDFLACGAVKEGTLLCPELLGNPEAASGMVTALGVSGGVFRTPGGGREFAMYHPLSDAPAPTYFGLAFD